MCCRKYTTTGSNFGKSIFQLKHPSRCSDSALIFAFLLCRTAPEVSEEDGSYASRFYRWSLKSFKSFSSRGSARFNRHSCTVASLKVPAMIASDVATKVLDTKSFPQHNIEHCWPDLWHYIYFLVQSGEAFMMEGNTHTHTHAHAEEAWKPSLHIITLTDRLVACSIFYHTSSFFK